MPVKDLQGNIVDMEGYELFRIKSEARHWLRESRFDPNAAKDKVRSLTRRHGDQAALLDEIDAQYSKRVKREREKARVA